MSFGDYVVYPGLENCGGLEPRRRGRCRGIARWVITDTLPWLLHLPRVDHGRDRYLARNFRVLVPHTASGLDMLVTVRDLGGLSTLLALR